MRQSGGPLRKKEVPEQGGAFVFFDTIPVIPASVGTVAKRVQELLKELGQWNPDYIGSSRKKVRICERCQKVLGYIRE